MAPQPACVGTDPEDWFSDDPAALATCVQVCTGCPVQHECLSDAVRRREQYSVWGGRVFGVITTHSPAVLRRVSWQGRHGTGEAA